MAYTDEIAKPDKRDIYVLVIYDEEDDVHVRYATAPVAEGGGIKVEAPYAVMDNLQLKGSSLDVHDGEVTVAGFTCDLIDRLTGDETKVGRVSNDLLGTRSGFSDERLQILDRRALLYYGFPALTANQYQLIFTGFIRDLAQISPGTFRIRVDGTISMLDREIFKHIKGHSTIPTSSKNDDKYIPLRNSDDFLDPGTHPLECHAYIEGTEETDWAGSWEVFQYFDKNSRGGNPALDLMGSGLADDVYGKNRILTGARATGTNRQVWPVGTAVWECILWRGNPLILLMNVMMTTAAGTNGAYDLGIADFGLEIPQGYVDITAIEYWFDGVGTVFEDVVVTVFHNYKILREVPLTGVRLAHDLLYPLGLVMTETNAGKIAVGRPSAFMGASQGTIDDTNLLKPPKELWSKKLLAGSARLYTRPFQRYDQEGSFYGGNIKKSTGTIEIFPRQGTKVIDYKSPYYRCDALEAYNNGADEAETWGMTCKRWYRNDFGTYTEPFPIIEVETHMTLMGLAPGNKATISTAFLHDLGAGVKHGQRGVDEIEGTILEKTPYINKKPPRLKFKVWLHQWDRWMTVTTTEHQDTSITKAAITFSNGVQPCYKNASWDDSWAKTTLSGDEAYNENEGTHKGDFMRLKIRIDVPSGETRESDCYARMAFIAYACDVVPGGGNPGFHSEHGSGFYFTCVYEPPGAGTETMYFYPAFQLWDKDRAYDVVVRFFRHNYYETTYIPTTMQLDEVMVYSQDWSKPY